MNDLVRLHDERFLRFVQDDYFGRPWLAGAVVVLVLLVSPVHRRVARIVIGVMTAWVLLTVVAYRGLQEAPLLGCVTVFAAVYSSLRGVGWWLLELSASKGKSQGRSSRFRPRGAWIEWILRDYLRTDPRGVYWLDLARASRGAIPERSRSDREVALRSSFELPPWRVRLWRFVFRLTEFRIWLWPRLPRYWHHDHSDLDLREAHLQAVLREEIARASRLLEENQSGRSFREYRNRTIDSAEHARALKSAGRYGLKFCLLTEALVESRLFHRNRWAREKRLAGEKRLCEIADTVLELWRYRRRNEHLWADELESISAKPAGLHSGPVIPASKPSAATVAQRLEAFQTVPDAGEPFSDSSLDDFASDDLNSTPDDDQPVTDDVEFNLESEVESSPDSKSRTAEDSDLSDADAFQRQTQKSESEPEPPPVIVAHENISPLDVARESDLRLACQLLEDYLDFRPDEHLSVTAQAAQRLLDRPANWLATTRLLMLYCLRPDLNGTHQERAKSDLIGRLRHWVRALQGHDDLVKSVRLAFFDLLIDWHSLHGGYTQIRELFGQNEPRGARHWELLGLAEAHIASQVEDRASLRDTLVRDATAALFRARVHGFWTQRYAGLLLGTHSSSETVRLLLEHSVEFGRPELERLLDQMPKPPAVRPDARDLVGESVDLDVETSSPPTKSKSTTTRTPRAAVRAKPKAGESQSDVAKTPKLTLVRVGKEERLTCPKFPIRFGSAKGKNEVCHPKLAAQHCEIFCKDGHLLVRSLTEGKSVFINDNVVVKPVRLHVGDVLKLGELQFFVESLG